MVRSRANGWLLRRSTSMMLSRVWTSWARPTLGCQTARAAGPRWLNRGATSSPRLSKATGPSGLKLPAIPHIENVPSLEPKVRQFLPDYAVLTVTARRGSRLIWRLPYIMLLSTRGCGVPGGLGKPGSEKDFGHLIGAFR